MKRLTINRIVDYFFIPILGTLFIIILFFTPLIDWINKEIPDNTSKIIFISILIFFILYLLNRISQKWILNKNKKK